MEKQIVNLKPTGGVKQALICVFALLSLVSFIPGQARASESPACNLGSLGEGSDQALLRCYQTEYQEKFKANDNRYKELIVRTKLQLQDALDSNDKKQIAQYSDLVHKLNQNIQQSRRSAFAPCVRLAAKFQSDATSVIAAINCRTESEVKLDRDLRQFEEKLDHVVSENED